MDQTFNSSTPVASADFNIATGALTVNYQDAATPTSITIAETVLSETAKKNYISTGGDGATAAAPSRSPGYPASWGRVVMDQWPVEGADMISTGDGLPSIQAWNLKDDQGGLYEIVYTNSSGTSNVLYKNSTTRPEHVVTLTPGGSKVVPDPSASPAPASTTETEAPLWLKVSSCCSSLVYCAGIVFLSSMLAPRK